jgi:hypothetical protein
MGRPHAKTPGDLSWECKCDRITEAITTAAGRYVPPRPKGDKMDVRGDLRTVSFGISFGGGQTARPGNLVVPGPAANKRAIDDLCNLPKLHKLAQVQSSEFWASVHCDPAYSLHS